MMTVSVFGGSGFLGQHIVRRLATEGMVVRVVTRDPDRARVVLDAAGLGQVSILCADVRDQAAVAAAVAGAAAVVNTVSAYVDRGGAFEAVHEQGVKTLAREALAAGVTRFVLVSGIGADPESSSPYIRSRGRGERLAQELFPGATIVRPSVMFGPGDALFGTVAQLLKADNVANSSAPGLRELGIEPKAIEEIVPTYLGRLRVGA